MTKNDLMAVLLRKINAGAQKDLTYIFEVLDHDYDEIISRQLFPVMDINGNHFDFWLGCFCGTVSKVADKSVLTDLALNPTHLL